MHAPLTPAHVELHIVLDGTKELGDSPVTTVTHDVHGILGLV